MVGSKLEGRLLGHVKAILKSHKLATEAEIAKRMRNTCDPKVVRQMLRRLRRRKKVEVVMVTTGKKKIRAYGGIHANR